jgi:hypothetical protein
LDPLDLLRDVHRARGGDTPYEAHPIPVLAALTRHRKWQPRVLLALVDADYLKPLVLYGLDERADGDDKGLV